MKINIKRIGSLKLFNTLVLLIVLIYFVISIVESFPLTYRGLYSQDSLDNIQNEWVDEQGESVDLESLDELVDANGDGKTSIYYVIPDTVEQTTYLSFMASNIYLEGIVDNQVIYQWQEPNMSAVGKSYGTALSSIEILPSYQGQTLQLDVECIYSDSGRIKDICIGSQGAYLSYFMFKHMSAAIISLIILILGCVFTILALAIPQERGLMASLFTFSVLSIFIGLWSLEETHIPLILTGNAHFWRIFDYPLLMTLPYLFMVSVNGLLTRPRKLYNIVAFGEFVFTLCTIVLGWVVFHKDFHELQLLVHGMVFVSIGVVALMIIRDRQVPLEDMHHEYGGRYYREDTLSHIRVLLWGVIIFLTCGIIDIMRYYSNENDVSDDAVKVVRIGYLIFEFAMFYRYIITAIQNMQNSTESQMYRTLAYTDALTGIKNRNAFLQREKELKEEIKTSRNFILSIVSLDLNYLGRFNHSYGKEIGDQYIIETARLIERCFGRKGEVYRIGNDEFKTFVIGADAERQTQELLKKMEQLEGSFDAELPEPFSVAYGYAVLDNRGEYDVDFDATEQLADQRMYHHKIQMKTQRKYRFSRF